MKTPVAATLMAGLLLTGCAGTTEKTAAPADDGSTTSSAASNAPQAPSASSLSPSPSPGSVIEPSEEPEPTATDSGVTDLALGESISLTGTSIEDEPFELSVGLDKKPKTSKRAVTDYGEKPKGTYVGFLVRYECVVGSCDYNPYDFTVRDDEGQEFEPSFGGSFQPELQSGSLVKGRKAKGYISYDLQPGAYYIEYRASLLDDEPANWKVTL